VVIHRENAIGDLVGFLRVGGGNQRRAVAARTPWSAWNIESIKVAKDGRTAGAVTLDGSAGLRLVDGEWRVSWVYDV